jgi:CheY-like chemotaxis protein
VLVADDHPINRALLTRQLALLGLDAEVVNDGAQALAMWQAQPFALLLTDCHMPVMDGYSLARHLRAAGERAPIIGVTADSSEEASQQMQASGMSDMLFKPYSVEMLRQKLTCWLPIAEGPVAVAPLSTSTVSTVDVAACWLALFGDAALARSMAREYIDANQHDGEMLRHALATHDLTAVVEAAHRIKGAARMVGQLALAAAAAHSKAKHGWLLTLN